MGVAGWSAADATVFIRHGAADELMVPLDTQRMRLKFSNIYLLLAFDHEIQRVFSVEQ